METTYPTEFYIQIVRIEQLTADARSRRLYRIRQPAGHRLDPSTCDTHTDTTVEVPFGVPPQRSPTSVSQAEGVYPGPQPLLPSTSRKVRCTRAQGFWTRVYVAQTPNSTIVTMIRGSLGISPPWGEPPTSYLHHLHGGRGIPRSTSHPRPTHFTVGVRAWGTWRT